MHYAPHALLNCVAWFSLLCYGNAAKGAAPSEVLSHFAHTVGTVLVPALANELHPRVNRSTVRENKLTRRQLDTRQATPQDDIRATPGAFPNQGFPFQFERNYQYRYPPFGQQLSQSFYSGAGGFNGLTGGLPLDPRFFQNQAGRERPLASIQPEIPKPLNSNINANTNVDVKESGNSGTSIDPIQNLDNNGDSKSSAQNRPPFDGQDFSVPLGGNGASAINSGARSGNFGLGNSRFSGIDYSRLRQNYYSDPQIDQQRNYFSAYNDVPLNTGPNYRSPLADRYSNLGYNGGDFGRGAGPNGDFRSGIGGNPYFGNFFQGPYQSPNYNSLPGSGEGGPGGFGGNFRSPFAAGGAGPGAQYPGGFNGGPFGPGGPDNFGGGGPGAGFDEGDSSLRASSAKETLAENVKRKDNEPRVKIEAKVRFVEADGNKRKDDDGEKSSSSQA